MKRGEELSEGEKDEMMELSIAEYPAFEAYYRKHKYYSAVKPQMVGLVISDRKIVGLGKFLWRDLEIAGNKIRLCVFGVLIASAHHREGLGTALVTRQLEEARRVGGDLLYGTTTNPAAEEMLKKLGFRELSVPTDYVDADSGETVRQASRAYAYELTSGACASLESQPILHLGEGPL